MGGASRFIIEKQTTSRTDIHFYIENRECELMCSRRIEPQVKLPNGGLSPFGQGGGRKKREEEGAGPSFTS